MAFEIPVEAPEEKKKRRGFLGFLLLSMLLGAAGNLAFTPWSLWPMMIVSLGGLVWLLEKKTQNGAQAFVMGYLFAFAHFGIGLIWIGRTVMLASPKLWPFVPLIPFAFGILGGFFPGIAAAFYWRGKTPAARLLVFAGAWLVMEWARSWFLTGLPWNLVGTVWGEEMTLPVLQIASVIGIYGVGLITVGFFGAFGLLPNWRPLAAWTAVLAACTVYGGVRMLMHPTVFFDDVLFRLVQPNVDQERKNERADLVGRIDNLIKLSRQGDTSRLSHVIWPETAFPYFVQMDAHRMRVAEAVPPGGALVTGSMSFKGRGGLKDEEIEWLDEVQMFNSVMVIDENGEISWGYNKVHLVPFGEYVPFKQVLKFKKLTQGKKDFSPGERIHTFKLFKAPPVSMLLCYEVIYPGRVAETEEKPDWLLNLVNDGWYADSAGPYQHMMAAKMRTLEEGIALVRVSNNGITAVVDPLGRITAVLPLNLPGVIDARLPKPVTPRPLYARYGNILPLLLALLVIAAGVFMRALPAPLKSEKEADSALPEE